MWMGLSRFGRKLAGRVSPRFFLSPIPLSAVITQTHLLQIYRSHDPAATFRCMVDAVSDAVPLRCALYLKTSDGSVRNSWPSDAR